MTGKTIAGSILPTNPFEEPEIKEQLGN